MYILVLIAAETESHSNIKMKENLSVDTKLNSFENELDKQNELDNSKTSQEVSKNKINLPNYNFLNKRLHYIPMLRYI